MIESKLWNIGLCCVEIITNQGVLEAVKDQVKANKTAGYLNTTIWNNKNL